MWKSVLSPEEERSLFEYLIPTLNSTPCDGTMRHTERWLKEHIPPEKVDWVLEEIEKMGGFCDCEVIFTAYK